MRSELEEVRGFARVRWACGIAWVFALGLVVPAVTAGIAFGVIGGAVENRRVFLEVYRSGSDSWIAALAFTVPTALVALTAALLVLRRHRAGLAFAYGFAALVIVSAVISVSNSAPVGPFMAKWEAVTTDPKADDHAEELRINSAIGAIGAALALIAVARRRRRGSQSRDQST